MDKQNFDKWLRDWHIVDCAVRSKDVLYFLLRKEYEVADDGTHPEEVEIDKRIINLLLNEPINDRLGGHRLTGFGITNIEVAQSPKPHAVAVDYGAGVYVMGSGLSGMEKEVPYDDVKGPRRGGMIKLRNIGGHIYGVGGRRSVCRREGPNFWIPMWGDTLPVPKVKRKVEENRYGFEDIDGFSQEDIYAVGGEGDVWHFDGQRWKQIPFPSNMDLRNVCCGGDGQVYIGAQSGNVFRGRGNRWQHIDKGGSSLHFEDMVWYQGRVWCTNDYGIWTITDGKVERADLPEGIINASGYASAADGVLLIAGMNGAIFHDGSTWQNLIDMGALYRKHGR